MTDKGFDINKMPQIQDVGEKAFDQWITQKRVETNWQPPIARNYQIYEIASEQQGNDLILQGSSRDILLNNLLPKGWSLKRGNGFSCNHETKTVYYETSDMQFRGWALSTLHEISHAYQKPIIDQIDLKTTISPRESLTHIARSSGIFLRNIMAKIRSIDLPQKPPYHPLEVFLPNEIMDKALGIRASEERDAWHGALMFAKAIEKQGVNVLGEFGNQQNIRDYISVNLASYEAKRSYLQWLSGRKTPVGKPFIKVTK